MNVQNHRRARFVAETFGRHLLDFKIDGELKLGPRDTVDTIELLDRSAQRIHLDLARAAAPA